MSAMSGSLDANVILRLVLRDAPKQSEAAAELVERGRRFLVADIAITETVFALERYYEIPRGEIAGIIQALANHPKLVIDGGLFEEALTSYTRFPKLSFEDCCLAAHAKRNAALPLWTFDEKLSKQLNQSAKLIKQS